MSESRLTMTAAQRGIYRDLLDQVAAQGGSLPTSETVLASLAAVSIQEFRKNWPVISVRFIERDGRLYNERMSAAVEKSERAHADRKKGGLARCSAPRNGHGKIQTSAPPEHPPELAAQQKLSSSPPLPLPIPYIPPLPPKGQSPPQQDEVQAEIIATATAMCQRHPSQRSCGPKECAKLLEKIISKDRSKVEKLKHLHEIDRRHGDWCRSRDWTKNSGEYAKALPNWLAPTVGRYETEAPAVLFDDEVPYA